MAGFVRVVAVDLDGTLTRNDRPARGVLAEIDRARSDGLAVILVTGRILEELESDFPGLRDRFDAVSGENGAVLALGDEVSDLAPPVEPSLEAELSRRGVAVRRGRVLLACDATDAASVVEASGALGLDCQVIRNRGALMVLPAGVSKGTGLVAALAELGISPHNAIAVGDAENDLALLEAAEVGIAVANAVPSLRRHADMVLELADGAGVAALLSGPICSGEQPVRPARRRLTIGSFEDGSPATVPGAQANLLVCGGSGAGKSFVAGLLVEVWVTHGYSVLVVDMEGDHVALERLHNTVVLDAQPSAAELLTVLRQHALSVVLDVSALGPEERLGYLHTLQPAIEAERAALGVPHWIVVDEAHATLGEGGVAADVFRPVDRGYCLITYHPEQLCAEALATIDVTITVSAADVAGTGRLGVSLRETGGLERPLTLAARRTPHVRHRRKYATTQLSPQRWFDFRHPDGSIVATAADLASFARLLQSVDADVVAHHLERGDFSRWIAGALQDRQLSAAVGAIERHVLARRAADVIEARARLLQAIDARYLDPPDDDERPR